MEFDDIIWELYLINASLYVIKEELYRINLKLYLINVKLYHIINFDKFRPPPFLSPQNSINPSIPGPPLSTPHPNLPPPPAPKKGASPHWLLKLNLDGLNRPISQTVT